MSLKAGGGGPTEGTRPAAWGKGKLLAAAGCGSQDHPVFPALSPTESPRRGEGVKQSPRVQCPELALPSREAGEAPALAPPAAGSASRVG